ncbi:hypothetical protein GCM10010302_17570 [Streptomyces polychromogenes]|uniref:Uncharacterized protein n=1 Tax=Streptomyces polychromogenes TaxID=67342 RepID=A0ABP3EYI5_9ACTN
MPAAGADRAVPAARLCASSEAFRDTARVRDLVDALRPDACWIPEPSLVAEDENSPVIAHIRSTGRCPVSSAGDFGLPWRRHVVPRRPPGPCGRARPAAGALRGLLGQHVILGPDQAVAYAGACAVWTL